MILGKIVPRAKLDAESLNIIKRAALFGLAEMVDETPEDVPLDFRFVKTYKTNDVKIFVDAAQVANDTTVSLPIGLTEIDIGKSESNANYLFGHVKDLRIYDVVLTPQQIAIL